MARLLVIDDEKAILDLVKNGLEKDGHIVAICGSATDVAVDRLKDYDLILLDIMMPDVDGFMFCKKNPRACGLSDSVSYCKGFGNRHHLRVRIRG